MREFAEFPYLDARIFIKWDKDVGDLGVLACRGLYCNSESFLVPHRDYWFTGAFGYVSGGVLKSGWYSLAVWILALKPDHINDPSVSVTLGVELIPYRIKPTKEGTVKVYGEKTTTSRTIKVKIKKDGIQCFKEWTGYGCEYDLGRFRVIGVEPPG